MADAGWYDDPREPGQKRYFDGSAWTDHVHRPDDAPPPPSAAAAAPTPANGPTTRREGRAEGKAEKARLKAMRPWFKKKRFLIPLALIVIGGIAAAAGGGGDDDDKTADRTSNDSDSDSDNTEDDTGDDNESDDPLDNVLTVGQTDDTSGLDVTLLTVEAPFAAGQFESDPDPGSRLIGVELSVTNTTDDDQVLSTLLNMEIKDDTGQRFDIALAGLDRPQLGGTILPGDTNRGWAVFEVPESATGLHLIVRGSITASGVRFDLGLG